MNAEGKAVPDHRVGSHKRVVELYSKLTDFLDQPRPGLRDAGAHDWATSLYRQLVELHETVSRAKRTVDERETLTKLALAHPRASRKLAVTRRPTGGVSAARVREVAREASALASSTSPVARRKVL